MNLDADPAAGLSPFLTYEPFYGLTEKPFSLASDPAFFYKSAAHRAAFDALGAGIRRREGLIVLSGEIGTGKTTLCRAVLAQLDRKTFSTFVPDPFVTREDLLKMLLIGFGVASVADVNGGRLQGASRQDLSYPLYEFLDSLVPLQAFAVLVIDEAQNLSLGRHGGNSHPRRARKAREAAAGGAGRPAGAARQPAPAADAAGGAAGHGTVRAVAAPLRRRHRIRQPPPGGGRRAARQRGLHRRGARGRVPGLWRRAPPHQSRLRSRAAARLRGAAEDDRSRHGLRGRTRPGPGRTRMAAETAPALDMLRLPFETRRRRHAPLLRETRRAVSCGKAWPAPRPSSPSSRRWRRAAPRTPWRNSTASPKVRLAYPAPVLSAHEPASRGMFWTLARALGLATAALGIAIGAGVLDARAAFESAVAQYPGPAPASPDRAAAAAATALPVADALTAALADGRAHEPDTYAVLVATFQVRTGRRRRRRRPQRRGLPRALGRGAHRCRRAAAGVRRRLRHARGCARRGHAAAAAAGRRGSAAAPGARRQPARRRRGGSRAR